jgi:3-methyladenine DNA glycosylase Mpg
VLLAAKDAKEHGEGVVKFVHHAFFERDNGVVGDANLLGTNLRATFGYIAETEAELILEQAGAVAAVEGMHFEAGDSNEEARAGELFLFVVFAKDMTNVLTEKTFDALAKLLHAVHVELGDFPFHSLARFKRRDFAVDTVIPGNVGDKVFDSREGFHRQDGDGLLLREVIHARFAG